VESIFDGAGEVGLDGGDELGLNNKDELGLDERDELRSDEGDELKCELVLNDEVAGGGGDVGVGGIGAAGGFVELLDSIVKRAEKLVSVPLSAKILIVYVDPAGRESGTLH